MDDRAKRNRVRLKRMGTVAMIGGGVVSLHGATTKHGETARRWRRAHTLFTLLGIFAGVLLKINWAAFHLRKLASEG